VKKTFFQKTMAIIPFFVIIISVLTFAADGDIVKTQGIVMELDLKVNYMVVNERQIVWDSNTIFYNEKGSLISVDKLRVKAWVYVEGVSDKAKKNVKAKKVYLLPKYINEKEKHLYPFIQ